VARPAIVEGLLRLKTRSATITGEVVVCDEESPRRYRLTEN